MGKGSKKLIVKDYVASKLSTANNPPTFHSLAGKASTLKEPIIEDLRVVKFTARCRTIMEPKVLIPKDLSGHRGLTAKLPKDSMPQAVEGSLSMVFVDPRSYSI